MFESKAGILYIAGIGFFVLAFVSNAVVPALMYDDLPEQTVEELVNSNLRYQFEDLARRYPESFNAAYGEPPGGEAEHDAWWNEKCAEALRYGHKLYVGEGFIITYVNALLIDGLFKTHVQTKVSKRAVINLGAKLWFECTPAGTFIRSGFAVDSFYCHRI